MREIKYRGQKTSTKEWVYGSLIVNKSGAHTIVQITDNPVSNGVIQGWCFGVMKDTVGQYTGLKDKNGKEIYESDIVEYDNGTKAKVIFKNGCFCGYDGYATSSDEAYTSLCPDETPFDGFDFELEVIGNIHENPELLIKD